MKSATCPRCNEELTFGQLGVVRCPHCDGLSEVVGHWPKVIIREWPGDMSIGFQGKTRVRDPY